MIWRAMTVADLSAVEAIAGAVHPGFFEQPAVFAERLRLYPQGVRLLDNDGIPLGYVLSHPFRFGGLPSLNSLLETLPEHPDTYYIHDLALLPEARGRGAASAVTKYLIAHATGQGLPSASLVALTSSQRFWIRHGFAEVEAPHLGAKLVSYEEGARYMVRALTS